MPTDRIPTVRRRPTDGASRLEAEGTTVREVFGALIAAHPGLDGSLLDGDRVPGFINVYVDDEDVRYLDGLDTVVPAGAEVSIMPAVAGGA